MSKRVTLNVPVRSTCMTFSHSSGFISSTGAVGPEMPALFTSTSNPPQGINTEGDHALNVFTFRYVADLCRQTRQLLRQDLETLAINVANEYLGTIRYERPYNFPSNAGCAGRNYYARTHITPCFLQVSKVLAPRIWTGCICPVRRDRKGINISPSSAA